MDLIQRKLKLTESEEGVVALDEDDAVRTQEKGKCCLMGKLLCHKNVGVEAIKTTLIHAWVTTGRVDCGNIFMFKFQLMDDLRKVKEGGPWHFDNNLMVLEYFNGNLAPQE